MSLQGIDATAEAQMTESTGAQSVVSDSTLGVKRPSPSGYAHSPFTLQLLRAVV